MTPSVDRTYIWGSPKSKNIDYKVKHPVFSSDENGKPNISYIDQFPEARKHGAGKIFTKTYQML